MTGFDIWNELGNIYFKVGAFDEAIDAYNKAIELDFRIGWLYSNLGFAYAHKGQYAEAILEYEKSIELLNADEDKAVSWSRLGEAYRQLHQYDQAIVAYQKAVELAPQDVSFSAGLSAVQAELGQLDQAILETTMEVSVIAEAEEPQASTATQDAIPAEIEDDDDLAPAVDDDDQSGDLAAGAVTRLFEEETVPAAASSAADPLQADEGSSEEPLAEAAPPVMQIVGEAPSPEPDPALEEPAVIAEEANSVAEMEMDTVIEPTAQEDVVSEKSPAAVVLEQDEFETTTVNSLLSSGIELWRKGDHEKASETLQAALEAAGKAENKWLEALSHNALALVKTELGKLEEAISSYIQAMQLAPEKIIPWNNIGHLYSKLDRNDEAMEAFLKAIEHNPEDFVSWDGLGDIYAKLGRLDDAIAAYQLGNVFGKQRHAEDALTAYQMIIEPVIDSVIESVMESPAVETPADNVWVAEAPGTLEPESNETDSAVMTQESPLESVAAETPAETLAEISQPVEENPVIETLSAASEEIVPAAPESVANEVVLTDEVVAEMVTETPQPVAENTVIETVSAVSDETEAQAASVVEETAPESVATETPEPIVESAAVEQVSAVSDETETQAAVAVEETVSEEIAPAAPESLATEVILTDEVPAEPVTETPEPIAENAEVSTVSAVSDETEAQAAVAVEETVSEAIVAPVSEALNEIVSAEELSTADQTAQAGEADTVGADIVAEKLEEPVAIAHELISVDALPAEAQSEQAVEAAPPAQTAGDRPPAQTAGDRQMPIPELIEEAVVSANVAIEDVQPEPESAISVEEIVMQAQAEEILENTSSSIELGRLNSAIAAYKKVTEINPENDRAWDSLGNLYRASERYSDATAAFERAISLRPNKEVYHYHLGLVYAAEKHYQEAIGAFQKVIALNPEYTFAHCALAGYFRKLGKEAEAQEHIEKALPKMTSEKEYDRACFAAICGNPDEALELLKIALEKKQTSLDWVRRDPDLDFIRDDQRFKTLVARNGSWSERLSDVFSKQLAWSPNK